MVCLDQWLGPTLWPDLKKTIKMMRVLQPDIMLRARGIGNYGDYYTPEGFVPGDKANTNMPWMVIYPLAKGFSYDKVDSDYKGSKWIIEHLVDAVAKGGNFMVGIGPDSNGHFHPKAVQQLKEAGRWLKINGEGIYSTRARKIWKEDPDIRFTTTKDKRYIYAFALSWPGETLILTSVKPAPGTSIRLLGYPASLKWDYANGRLTIHIPATLQKESARPCRSAWAFRIREQPG
jgi:alpha-L-fucosidase